MSIIKLKIANDGERCGDCESNENADSTYRIFKCRVFDLILEGHGLLRCQPCLDAEVKDG